jgi:hypothetical protein
MTENVSSEEFALGDRIRAYADAGAPARDPNVVVQAVIAGPPPRLARLPLRLIASASGLLLLVIVAFAAVSQTGIGPARAHVGGITLWGINIGGTTYDLGVVRSIDLDGVRLTAVGEAHQDYFRTQGSMAYQVDDVDPQQVLVMKLAPGERDDAGSIGDYVLLARGDAYSLLCPYFHAGDPLAPSECN